MDIFPFAQEDNPNSGANITTSDNRCEDNPNVGICLFVYRIHVLRLNAIRYRTAIRGCDTLYSVDLSSYPCIIYLAAQAMVMGGTTFFTHSYRLANACDTWLAQPGHHN
eukprot:2524980-Prymnesium_polylepis.1